MTAPPAGLAAELAGRYRIGPELGAGGMATVYLADDVRHRRRVAIKVLRPELGAVLGAERFLHEIRVTAQLQHPHILPLFDSGATGNHLWYAMPLVEGESLRDRLAREGPLAIETALALAAQVANALDYAHRHGVVHRDIKPANILLVEDQALVADFGIALGINDAAATRLTGTGLALGTPQYMSAEQALGQAEVDARTDVYALGCVLFEMLTGRPPFVGATVPAIVAQVLTARPPRVSSLRPDAPAALDPVLERAMARSPDERYQTAGDFGAAIRALTGGSRAQPTAAARRARRRALAGIAIGLAAVAGWLVLRSSAAPIPQPGQTARLTFTSGAELDPAPSPDGRMLAFAGGPVGRSRIYVRQVGAGSPVVLSDGLEGNHRLPRWSADGARIAFLVSGTGPPAVYVLPALGGAPRRLARLPSAGDVQGYAWSPDGATVVYAADSVIYAQEVDGHAAPRLVGTAHDPHSFTWCPDGAHLAYVSGNPTFMFGTASLGNMAPSQIQMVAVAGGPATLLTDLPALNVSPAWAPGGGGLYFVSSRGGARDIWYQPLSHDHRPRGDPVRLTTGLQAHAIAVAGDGSRVLYSALALQANLWRVALPPPTAPPRPSRPSS